MSHWNKAAWTKNGDRISGSWMYRRSSDSFFIQLDAVEPVTGDIITTVVQGDHPEFNGWKLVREEK